MPIPLVLPSCTGRPTRGFTLIEVLVALSLLGFGLLSLAGSVTIVTRLVDQSRTSGRTAFVALGQIESLRHASLASPSWCGGSASGSLIAGDLTGSWSAAAMGPSLRVVVEIVSVRGRTQATDTVSTVMPC
jgi:prepilin-type N-terminal cleavage/methylation domain-containing protein